jgi:hypothetical protein
MHAHLPFIHSCTADAAVQEQDLRRADEHQERAARGTPSLPSFLPPSFLLLLETSSGTGQMDVF